MHPGFEFLEKHQNYLMFEFIYKGVILYLNEIFSLERDGLVEYSAESNGPAVVKKEKIIPFPNKGYLLDFHLLFKPTFRRILPSFFRGS